MFIRKLIPVLAVLLSCTCLDVGAQDWTVDMSAAKSRANDSGRDLLLNFSGSDWCAWCKKLNAEVFTQPDFVTAAQERFVLVEIDFPRQKPQPPNIKQQNLELARDYRVDSFPTVLLADAAGDVYARTGYRPGGTKSYIRHLDELRARREAWLQLLAEAEKSEDLEAAHRLDEALKLMVINRIPEDPLIMARIVQLDKDDRAGLRSQYAQKTLKAYLESQIKAIEEEMHASGDFNTALELLDQLMEKSEPMPEIRQKIYLHKAAIYHHGLKTPAATIENLEKALACAPQSSVAPEITGLIERLRKAAAENDSGQ